MLDSWQSLITTTFKMDLCFLLDFVDLLFDSHIHCVNMLTCLEILASGFYGLLYRKQTIFKNHCEVKRCKMIYLHSNAQWVRLIYVQISAGSITIIIKHLIQLLISAKDSSSLRM